MITVLLMLLQLPLQHENYDGLNPLFMIDLKDKTIIVREI